MKPLFLLALAFLAWPGTSALAESLVDRCVYPDDGSASRAWVEREGSPLAAMGEVNGEPALELPCLFAGNVSAGRHYWDREFPVDLQDAEGLQLDVYCANPGPISSLTLYFRTGKGWRSTPFSLSRAGVWETITLRKTDAEEEGQPGGWDQVSALRLAAWKGQKADTSLHIRNLRRFGVLGEDTRILLVRNGADAKDPFADQLSDLLSGSGLRHAFAAESALTPVLLAKAELLVLPHNPGLPEAAVQSIKAYLQGNGKLLAFYSLHPALRGEAGIAGLRFLKPAFPGQFSAIQAQSEAFPDAPGTTPQSSWNIAAPDLTPGKARVLALWCDESGKSTGFPAIIASDRVVFMSHVLLQDGGPAKLRLLLAMAGRLRPDCWREVISRHRAGMDRIGEYASYPAAREALLQRTRPQSEARARLEQAADQLNQAEKFLGQSQFARALESTQAADRALREAYCLAQDAKPGEFRAMWCHSAYGVKGMSWDAAIQRLKENGFNAILPNMLWGGVAYYPSEVLPVAAAVQENGDAMAECLAACRKHGLQMHVWKVNWNLGHHVPASFVERMRTEKRLQSSFRGEEQLWLCPSHPENLALERESLLEVARKYPVDGIHFDYIRYPGPDYCFCASCRERFEKATGEAVASWPDDVRGKGSRREAWIGWCQENIHALVRTTSEQARKIRPGIQISAAVFRDWESDSRSVMQDWKLWCQNGWLDFVCPMNYTASDRTFETWVSQQKALAPPAGLVPGIGASSSRVSKTADQVAGQISITRRHGTKGFVIFNYGEREATETIPLLGLGVTRPP